MNEKKLKIFAGLLLIALIIIFIICYFYENKKDTSSDYVQIDTEGTDLEVEYNNAELTGEWSDYSAKITLDDTKTIVEGKGVTNNGNVITINSAGTYYITGTISDGNILIEADKNDEVQLVLDNASITSNQTAPINGITADKLTITLAENSTNTITDSSSYTTFTDTEKSEPDGAIFTKTDLVINGNGKLVVDANYSDGIKSTNIEDTELGYIAIEEGTIIINSETDGIQAEIILNISSNAKINVTTKGKITSSKGLKAGTEITINGGDIVVTSTDDSIHSNGIIVINDGTIKASSGDDGIHADTSITTNGGNIDVAKSYEGIESGYIEINGGTINVIASDDGINVAGGNDSSSMNGKYRWRYSNLWGYRNGSESIKQFNTIFFVLPKFW